MHSINNPDSCQISNNDFELIREKMYPSNTLLDLAEIFKVLGDHTRVRILHALSISDLCVCSLSSLLNMSPSAISHQMRILRASKIVKFRKEGKHVYYSLDDRHVENLIQEGLEHVQE